MSAVALDRVAPVGGRTSAAVPVLALQEGWRIARHPASLAGLAWGTTVALLLADNGPRDAFEVVGSAVTFFLGVPVYFAANLVASRDRRAHSGELLAASPVREQARTVALLLGALVPAGLALALVLLGHAVQHAVGTYEVVPGVWHLLTGPATVLGGALLGIMVARWLPVPGAAALVMVGMVAWNVWATNRPDSVSPLGTYVSWARWNDTPAWVGFERGSPSWHVAYLLGLCAMAAAGALLPGSAARWRVLLVGGALTALTALFGWLQLP